MWKGLLLGSLFLISAWLAVTRWWIGFSSDYALIGLIAKHFFETGEFALFIPGVGYQGLLWVEGLAALSFSMFGVSPQALHLSAALTHGIFLITCVWYFARIWNYQAGIWIALGSLISAPIWHEMLFRTQPNYAEVFTLGLLALGRYQIWLNTKSNRDLWILGALSGFGMYTYGQMAVFLGAIFIDLWIYQRPRWHPTSVPWHQNRSGALNRWLLGVALTIVLLCIPMFIFGLVDIRIGSTSHGLRIRSYLAIALFLLMLWQWFGKDGQPSKWIFEIKLWLYTLGPGIAGFLIGFAPTLYYRWILGLPSDNRLKTVIGLPQIVDHLWILVTAQPYFLGLPQGTHLGIVILWTVLHWGLWVWVWVKHKTELPRQLWALGIVFVILFILSDNIIDVYSIRYLVFMNVLFAVAAYVFHKNQPRRRRPLLAVAMGAVLTIKGALLWSFWHQTDKPLSQELVALLDRHQVRSGTADYWIAHLVTFSTQGRITLRPAYSDYLPYSRLKETSSEPKAWIEFVDRPLFPHRQFDSVLPWGLRQVRTSIAKE